MEGGWDRHCHCVNHGLCHVCLSLPQSATKKSETLTADGDPLEVNRVSARASLRRATRSNLWAQPEDDLLLLGWPLEVTSETPVADALIKRLQDEEGKQDGMFDFSEGRG